MSVLRPTASSAVAADAEAADATRTTMTPATTTNTATAANTMPPSSSSVCSVICAHYGMDASHYNALACIDDHTVIVPAGRFVLFVDVSCADEDEEDDNAAGGGGGNGDGKQRHKSNTGNRRRGVMRSSLQLPGDAVVGALAVHPSRNCFVVGERDATQPQLRVYALPLPPSSSSSSSSALSSTHAATAVFSGGAVVGYAAMTFDVHGTRLATVAAAPDYTLAVWDWATRSLLLRSRCFAAAVYTVALSAFDATALVTSGVAHVKQWHMARTFTGAKLQGSVGKFDRLPRATITAVVMLPGGTTLTGGEDGHLLVWEGELVKCCLVRGYATRAGVHTHALDSATAAAAAAAASSTTTVAGEATGVNEQHQHQQQQQQQQQHVVWQLRRANARQQRDMARVAAAATRAAVAAAAAAARRGRDGEKAHDTIAAAAAAVASFTAFASAAPHDSDDAAHNEDDDEDDGGGEAGGAGDSVASMPLYNDADDDDDNSDGEEDEEDDDKGNTTADESQVAGLCHYIPCHDGAITAMALVHDAATVVTAGEDGVLRYWSRAMIEEAEGVGVPPLFALACLREVRIAPRLPITCIALLPPSSSSSSSSSSSMWCVLSRNGCIYTAALPSADELHSSRRHRGRSAGASRPTSSAVAATMTATTTTTTITPRRVLACNGMAVTSATACVFDHVIVLGGADGVVRVVDYVAGEELCRLHLTAAPRRERRRRQGTHNADEGQQQQQQHEQHAVTALYRLTQLTSDTTASTAVRATLLAGSADGTLRVLQLLACHDTDDADGGAATGDSDVLQLRVCEAWRPHTRGLFALAVSPDERQLCTLAHDGVVFFFAIVWPRPSHHHHDDGDETSRSSCADAAAATTGTLLQPRGWCRTPLPQPLCVEWDVYSTTTTTAHSQHNNSKSNKKSGSGDGEDVHGSSGGGGGCLVGYEGGQLLAIAAPQATDASTRALHTPGSSFEFACRYALVGIRQRARGSDRATTTAAAGQQQAQQQQQTYTEGGGAAVGGLYSATMSPAPSTHAGNNNNGIMADGDNAAALDDDGEEDVEPWPVCVLRRLPDGRVAVGMRAAGLLYAYTTAVRYANALQLPPLPPTGIEPANYVEEPQTLLPPSSLCDSTGGSGGAAGTAEGCMSSRAVVPVAASVATHTHELIVVCAGSRVLLRDLRACNNNSNNNNASRDVTPAVCVAIAHDRTSGYQAHSHTTQAHYAATAVKVPPPAAAAAAVMTSSSSKSGNAVSSPLSATAAPSAAVVHTGGGSNSSVSRAALNVSCVTSAHVSYDGAFVITTGADGMVVTQLRCGHVMPSSYAPRWRRARSSSSSRLRVRDHTTTATAMSRMTTIAGGAAAAVVAHKDEHKAAMTALRQPRAAAAAATVTPTSPAAVPIGTVTATTQLPLHLPIEEQKAADDAAAARAAEQAKLNAVLAQLHDIHAAYADVLAQNATLPADEQLRDDALELDASIAERLAQVKQRRVAEAQRAYALTAARGDAVTRKLRRFFVDALQEEADAVQTFSGDLAVAALRVVDASASAAHIAERIAQLDDDDEEEDDEGDDDGKEKADEAEGGAAAVATTRNDDAVHTRVAAAAATSSSASRDNNSSSNKADDVTSAQHMDGNNTTLLSPSSAQPRAQQQTTHAVDGARQATTSTRHSDNNNNNSTSADVDKDVVAAATATITSVSMRQQLTKMAERRRERAERRRGAVALLASKPDAAADAAQLAVALERDLRARGDCVLRSSPRYARSRRHGRNAEDAVTSHHDHDNHGDDNNNGTTKKDKSDETDDAVAVDDDEDGELQSTAAAKLRRLLTLAQRQTALRREYNAMLQELRQRKVTVQQQVDVMYARIAAIDAELRDCGADAAQLPVPWLEQQQQHMYNNNSSSSSRFVSLHALLRIDRDGLDTFARETAVQRAHAEQSRKAARGFGADLATAQPHATASASVNSSGTYTQHAQSQSPSQHNAHAHGHTAATATHVSSATSRQLVATAASMTASHSAADYNATTAAMSSSSSSSAAAARGGGGSATAMASEGARRPLPYARGDTRDTIASSFASASVTSAVAAAAAAATSSSAAAAHTTVPSSALRPSRSSRASIVPRLDRSSRQSTVFLSVNRERMDAELRSKLEHVKLSEAEEEERVMQQTRLRAERQRLCAQSRARMSAFDEQLRELAAVRVRVDADVCRLQLRMLLLVRECELLLVYRSRERTLRRQLRRAEAALASLEATLRALDERRRVRTEQLSTLQERLREATRAGEEVVQRCFAAEHVAYVLRVYRRRLKRRRGHDAAEASDDDDVTSEDEDDDGDGAQDGDDDDDDDALDEVCPAGCDAEAWSRVLRLREQRLDLLDGVADAQASIAQTTSELAEAHARVCEVQSRLRDAQGEVDALEAEKMQALNALRTVVLLSCHQVRCVGTEKHAQQQQQQQQHEAQHDGSNNSNSNNNDDGSGGEGGPADMQSAPVLLIAESTLSRLQHRLVELAQQKQQRRAAVAALQDELQRAHADVAAATRHHDEWQSRVREVMMLKFGQCVDLEQLESCGRGSSWRVECRKEELRQLEQSWEREVRQQHRVIAALRDELQSLLLDNTDMLHRYGDDMQSWQQTEHALARATSKTLQTYDGEHTATRRDRDALRALIAAQQQEMDALRAEVDMLRRKGGHAYSAVDVLDA